MIRGFKQWQSLGRHLNKGERSIDILVPTFQKTEEQKIHQPLGNVLTDGHGDVQSEVKKL